MWREVCGGALWAGQVSGVPPRWNPDTCTSRLCSPGVPQGGRCHGGTGGEAMSGHIGKRPPTTIFFSEMASHFFLTFLCTILYLINKTSLF